MSEQNLIRYDDFVAQHTAAYEAFVTIHKSRYAMPEKPVVRQDSIFIYISLIVMIVACIIVSGHRTVDEFGGGWVGLAAFVMLECGIVSYAFFLTRRNFKESQLDNTRRLAIGGLILALLTALAANVHSVMREQGVVMPEWISTGILVFVSISAPTLAFISGDMLALETMGVEVRRKRAEKNYGEALSKWHEDLQSSWNSQKSKWGIRVEKLQDHSNSIPVIPLERNGMEKPQSLPSRSILGHSKQPQASVIVREHLDTNPDAIQLDPRELATLLGVGKSTAYKIVMEYRQKGEQ